MELRTLACAVTVAAALVWASAVSALELIMVEEQGCIYCARWDREIAPEYPKTAEGRAAPLRRVDINQPWPEDLQLASRVVYTPTFIIVDDGEEIIRLEGYPGEDFFWPALELMISKARESRGS